MIVERYLGGGAAYRRRSLNFAEHRIKAAWPVPPMHRNLPLQVRQREGRRAVAAIGCTKDREQGSVLLYREQLAVAHCPAVRREVKPEAANFPDKGRRHGGLLNCVMGRCLQARCRTKGTRSASDWDEAGSRRQRRRQLDSSCTR